jgi:hypothetical protein
MHSVFRHFVASLFSVMIFTAAGTGDGFLRVIHQTPNADAGASLLLTGMANFVMACALSLVVLTPVSSIAQYLFDRRWSFPFYLQIPLLVPLLAVYLFPWALVFGRHATVASGAPAPFLFVLGLATLSLTLPLLIYWAVFRGLDRHAFT